MEEHHQHSHSCLVIWRGQKFVVEINPDATLKELGDQLQKLTNVKADTLRLLVPMEKSSAMLYPFSDIHSQLSLETTSVLKGKSIRMMGVLEDEVDEILQNAKVDLRIAGFDEEEKRLRQKNLDRSNTSWKLPQGTYIFCDFGTLSIPGMELNPPASKALELLHMLASDPGIVAIMNKHHWRVGILTEMAPIGYVGVSPKCILGVNKNHGEEISLRLRTDDLKGFRKYESIKKTLLHELAHMMYSEHDANFYALDKQLNKEAATLDWTKSRGHTLSGFPVLQHYKEDYNNSVVTSSQKLGGQASILPNARASSVSAAYQRLASTSTALLRSSENSTDPDPEPDVDDDDKSMGLKPYVDSEESHVNVQVDPDNSQMGGVVPASETERCEVCNPGVSGSSLKNNTSIDPNFSGEVQRRITGLEPEFDDCGANTVRPDQTDPLAIASIDLPSIVNISSIEPEPNDSQVEVMWTEPDSCEALSRSQTIQPDPDYQNLQIIQDPVALVCDRLQNAIQSLKNVTNPSEALMILHTLIKIISNVIEQPNELKFKKLRKANPVIHRNVVRYRAAMDILILIGFCEDVIIDEIGKAEDFLVLKRNDPGLLWLAKSSLETHIT